jgi:hypothetical protein
MGYATQLRTPFFIFSSSFLENFFIAFCYACFMKKRRLIFCGIIFLISTFSFAAGYLANRESAGHAPIIIEKCSSTSSIDSYTQ